MRLLTDSEARERDKVVQLLREENIHLKQQIKSQDELLNFLRESFNHLSASLRQPALSNPQITREDIARKLRIPPAYIDQIDMQALGVQLNEGKR